MATLKDIATKCNVSVSTVSRILKNDKTLSVNDKTKELVWDAANQLDYKVKGKSTNGVKLAVVNWYSHDQEVIDPYYYYIRKGVESQCDIEGFEYDVYFKENSLSELFNYDAIIAIGKFSSENAEKLSKLVNGNIIFVDSNPDRVKYDSVQVDFECMMEDIFTYVLDNHNDSIGLMIGAEYIEDVKVVDPRLSSYIKQCKLNGLDEQKFFIEGDFTIESGYAMFEQLASEGRVPKTIICGNDLIAMGANKAAYKLGYTVGTDVNIVGINNIPVAKYMVPSLTTVEIPQIQMGNESVSLVKRKIIDQSTNPVTILVPTRIVSRKSC
ncbi:LacI family DNA-binding transcriptional regulator [Mollicutes bacterium LVI A0039]|nr:LacI family DNA-binding transcriptional regulator [Mollicutes bacterium LVI A0039]